MDFLDGISLSDREALVRANYDLTDLARRGANMFLQMVFRDGFYHADPHPGNLMVLEGEVIGVLDCGMVGRVDDILREQIEDLLIGLMDGDVDRVTDAIVEMADVPVDYDRVELQGDIAEFVDEYSHQSIDRFDLSGALNSITDTVRNHRISLPSQVSLLIKMLVMLEGTAQQLSPNFSIAELIAPYKVEAIKRRLSPHYILRKLARSQRNWSRLFESLPGDVADIINRARKGTFDVHIEHRRIEGVVNRLVLGILTAALLVASALLWSNDVGPFLAGVSVPGALGSLAAVGLGFYVVRAIGKSGEI